VKQRLDAPASTAIPWLLLSTKTHEGNGFFSKVTYIRRLNTQGGKAPATGCDRLTHNSTTRVNYTADHYYFAGQ
jgi:hypothetical protein